MSGNDFGDWYRSIPSITRYWFTAAVAVPLIARFGIISPTNLVFFLEPFLYKFQIWRAITGLLYFPVGFPYLINLFFLYSYSTRLEQGTFDGCPADYLFMLIFNCVCLLLIAAFANIVILFDLLIMSVMYVWCQLNRDTIVQFWFGAQFKAMYLPWVLFAFNFIIRGSGFSELIGIAVGHLYFFLMFKYPQDFNGVTILKTPEILYKWLPNRRGGVSGFGQAPTSRRNNNDDDNNDRYRNVRGYRLGD